MRKYLILLFIPLFNINSGFAQDSLWLRPLHKFLQQNADSTVMFQRESNFIELPEYTILSKKGDTITAYKYSAPPKIDKRINLPSQIRKKLYQRDRLDLFLTPIDANFYFNPIYIEADSLNQFWLSVSKLEPWKIKYDIPDWPIDKDGNKVQIYDGGYITFFLITKDNIKKVSYYAAHSYEKLMPGNKDRQKIIKMNDHFFHHFGPASRF